MSRNHFSHARGFWHKAHEVDPVELTDHVMATVQSAIDAALDTLLEVADRVQLSPDDVRAWAATLAGRFQANQQEWRDDDDPGEALR